MTMFDEFLRNCPMEDEIKPSQKRVKKNIVSVKSLIGSEENNMTKRRFRLKPLIIVAVITTFLTVSLFAVDAAMQGAVVRFFMGGEELDGEYYDYVDSDGFRRISFSAVLPIDEDNYAIIYDVDAPQGENMRIITDETDPDFMEKLRNYRDANTGLGRWEEVDAADFGLVFKDSELCTYSLTYQSGSFGGTKGGNFMCTHTETGKGKPSGYSVEYTYDKLNGTKTRKETFYYYVGKE